MTTPLAEGQKAPAFELPSSGGGTLSMDALAGKKVVLYFYPRDDTPGCTAQAIDFNRLRQDFAAVDTEIVGVSSDTVASHDKFKIKHDLDLALVSDEDKQMLEAYGVWVEKNMYGKKSMGVERTTFLIDRDGTIVKKWPKVKVPGHAQAVLAAAAAL